VLTIIKGPRGSGKTTIAKGLQRISNQESIIIDEFDPISKSGLKPRERTDGRFNWDSIEDINVKFLQQMYKLVIICLKPGCRIEDLEYSHSDNWDAFVVDLSGGYKYVFN
jgi:uridine kinase